MFNQILILVDLCSKCTKHKIYKYIFNCHQSNIRIKMFTNKSPYSQQHKKDNDSYSPNPSTLLFAAALNKNIKPHKKNKENNDIHFHNLKMIKRKINPGMDIDLECDEEVVSTPFQQDLTCNQEIQLYAPIHKQKYSPFKNQHNKKNVHNHSKEDLSPKVPITPRQRKITQPVSIDLHCTQKLVNFDHMKTQKLEKIEPSKNQQDQQGNQKWKQMYYRVSQLLDAYQRELLKRQQRIDFLESKEKYRRM